MLGRYERYSTYSGVGVIDVAVRVIDDWLIAAKEVEAEAIGRVVKVEQRVGHDVGHLACERCNYLGQAG